MRATVIFSELSLLKRLSYRLNANLSFASETWPAAASVDDPDELVSYSDVPKPLRRKSERKAYVTPMKVLIERAKKEREARKKDPCRVLEEAPENGLLVPELVEVAHRVYQARRSLLSGLSQLVRVIPVLRCELCNEVHIGYVGHEIRTCNGPKSYSRNATHVWRRGGVRDVVFFPKCFHLFDRVGKPRVGHDERFSVPRIPAIVELCIQAGLDLEKHPTRRRTKPVYCIEGRIVDFESVVKEDEQQHHLYPKLVGVGEDETKRKCSLDDVKLFVGSSSMLTKPLEKVRNLVEHNSHLDQLSGEERSNLRDLSKQTLDSWFEMTSGAKKIMEKYVVNTCGYCPEVQVGPKGHKLRMCKASKHQSRNGLHAWQEATIDDVVGPNYVWHVEDLNGPALNNNLKRYYGKAPAVVELCVHAGAPVPDHYTSMMRLDVVSPDRDEVDLVA
ncbi:APO protein 3, mitochondrial isoform X1 [Gastrolobium bilobum]|uniref:APO protein 3, mitochondrial isoform X1 n=1 Tax=Gastrolobium bilobum TaxID=150636 RepID=UPI002AB27D77|nr:APO protein 3, mitochondrial isoform X1 [Gastrolobium bilobum]